MQAISGTPVDHEALAGALRALGLLYGAAQPPAQTMAGAATEAEAVRAYLERERPHLLRCYDLDALVKLVLEVRSSGAGAPPSMERFGPAQ